MVFCKLHPFHLTSLFPLVKIVRVHPLLPVLHWNQVLFQGFLTRLLIPHDMTEHQLHILQKQSVSIRVDVDLQTK